jgi:putative peptidoglycan lipid II flippase
MLRKLLSVGGFTLLSRLTGFARDMVLAAILGASALMDVFIVALKLPNHFRAIFGEGAFNQAYVPVYARLREQAGEAKAALFSNRVFTLLLIVQLALLALALPFMPVLVGLIAPGFAHDPARFDLAVALARVTFPYLTCITLVTLLSGNLNAIDRFAAAAAAPVLLNISIVAALAIAFLFPTAAHAAAWGVLAAGLLELLLLVIAARRAGVAAALARPRIDPDMKAFFKALGPAVIGSAGVQIALFADTIIASLLPQGSYAALYYAERLYQLPIGVIAIAAGTVLLPTMSRALARGDEVAAARGQNRTLGLALLLAGPAVAVCLAIPEMAVGALFGRGAFDQAAAEASGRVLAAYAIGLPAIVVIRAIVTSFHARSDTRTPVFISFAAIGLNIGLKLLLWRTHGASGLAFATAAGAWANALLLYAVALRRGWTRPDRQLVLTAGIVAMASLAMALALIAALPFAQGLAAQLPQERKLGALVLAGLAGLLAYLAIAAPSISLVRRALRG